jgi:predicted enzyme related to lactoylglutathione lyase
MGTRTLWITLLGLAALLATGCRAGPKPVDLPPIVAQPTGVHLPGKFVWFDLFTHEVEKSKTFYGELFGWTFDSGEKYLVIRNDGVPVAGLAPVDAGEGAARWVPSLSVDDPDAAAALVAARGGRVQEGPVDLGGRGRLAMVTDPQGAQLVLLRSAAGDPKDAAPEPGGWLWVDLFTPAPAKSLALYQDLAGYGRLPVKRKGPVNHWILHRGPHWRAGVIDSPWESEYASWVPGILVEDPSAVCARVQELGGAVIVGPGDDLSDGTAALISDPAGAALMVEKRK